MWLNFDRGGFVLLLLVLAGCASTDTIKREDYTRPIVAAPRVLLMEADVEVGQMDVSGLVTPNAVWTRISQQNVDQALNELMTRANATLISYDTDLLDGPEQKRHRELIRLYEVVGGAMLTRDRLPTASKKTDWTLGPGVRDLTSDQPADYALFVFVRDQYASAGKIAADVVSGLLFGVSGPAPLQYGYAALVDLQTGDIVWFNRLSRAAGDLRKPEPAEQAVQLLLDECPIL